MLQVIWTPLEMTNLNMYRIFPNFIPGGADLIMRFAIWWIQNWSRGGQLVSYNPLQCFQNNTWQWKMKNESRDFDFWQSNPMIKAKSYHVLSSCNRILLPNTNCKTAVGERITRCVHDVGAAHRVVQLVRVGGFLLGVPPLLSWSAVVGGSHTLWSIPLTKSLFYYGLYLFVGISFTSTYTTCYMYEISKNP